jgi:2-keto-4-pentenoate hydratase/2-oxohepta-3-ene-1,7-dioic acid hydratase in catechol pathway
VLEGNLALAQGVVDAPGTLLDLVRSENSETWIAAVTQQGDWRRLEELQMLSPVPAGSVELIAIGLNYHEHAAESRQHTGLTDAPSAPVVFGKASTSIAAPGADVLVQSRLTHDVDWEVELAIIIGRSGRDIAVQGALQHVFGYTVANDLSARDVQFGPGGQWYLGKSFDGFCPMGPVVIRPTGGQLSDRSLSLRVNGQTKQQANTRDLIFGVPQLIAHLSRMRTLTAGTVILSGTPGGIGYTREPRERLAHGDIVEAEIEGIGVIANRIVIT